MKLFPTSCSLLLFLAVLVLPTAFAHKQLVPRAVIPTTTPVVIQEMVGLWHVQGSNDCGAAVTALQGLSIPYTLNTVVANANNVITLRNADGSGKYNMIVICSDRLAYLDAKTGAFPSALTDAQWADFTAYEAQFKVRRAVFGVWPGPLQGVNYPPNGACCGPNEEQLVQLSPEASKLVPLAGINAAGKFSTIGMSHYPTTLYTGQKFDNFANATPILYFDPVGTKFPSAQKWIGGVISKYSDGRQEMNFYMAFGSWSTTSIVLQHLWIQWGLRSAYPGFRRAYLIPQIDDVFLPTSVTVNTSAPVPVEQIDQQKNTKADVRLTLQDLLIHKIWQDSLTARLPAGSNFKIELIYNGNGAVCIGNKATCVYTKTFPEVDYDFVKPLGTGTNMWPANQKFAWTPASILADVLYSGVLFTPGLQSSFLWVSHTFTHMKLNNATYDDVFKEMSFNNIMAGTGFLNLVGKPYYSPNSLVPPAITGLFNGDALRAMRDNNIKTVCGDNTRPELMSTVSPFHPIKTTLEKNGFAGITIIPRFATNIYYNVSTIAEEEYLYNVIYFNKFPKYSTWRDIYDREADRVTSQLIALHPDAYMFHQANLRAHDINQTLPPYFPKGKFSLLMLWVERIAEAYKKYVNWPLVTYPMDTMSKIFLDRQNRDTCRATMFATISGGKLTAIQVRGGTCDCTWPVTVPTDVQRTNPAWKYEKLGNDPLTVWVPLKAGSVVTLMLNPSVDWT